MNRVSSSSIKYIKNRAPFYSRFKVNLAQQKLTITDEQLTRTTRLNDQSKLIKTVTRSYEMTIELIDDDTLDHVIDLLKRE